jgi:hypothetical protein
MIQITGRAERANRTPEGCNFLMQRLEFGCHLEPPGRTLSYILRWPTCREDLLQSRIGERGGKNDGSSPDSPLEEGVWSEPVSEVGFSAPGNYGIPRPLWTIVEAEKGYFGLENGEFQSLPPWQLPPLSGS